MGKTFSKELYDELNAIENQRKVNFPLSKERQELAEKNGLNFRTRYNIAFVGVAGAGKSSLINAVRGLRHKEDEQQYAKTGIVECTVERTPYVHPEYKSIILWDMPGGAVQSNPTDSYFEKKCLEAYDFLVIVVKNDIVELDSIIIKEAIKRRVPFALVRMKIDQDIKNNVRHTGQDFSKAKQHIRMHFMEKLTLKAQEVTNGIVPPHIFLVSETGFDCEDPKSAEYRIDELYLLKMVLSISKGRRVAFMISQAKEKYRKDICMT